MHPISSSEIINSIKALASKNSFGTDGVSSDLVKNCMYGLIAPLQILFNLSITEGVFLDQLKTAIVVPVFKAGVHSDMSNYRPIALLSVISKLLEYIVKNRVMDYLFRKKFFSDRQFGFLPGLSTDDALVSHITDIVSFTERNNIAVALYLDIKKAFDTVDHSILLDKLYSYGFRGTVFNWFSTYLRGRSQVVRIGDRLSPPPP